MLISTKGRYALRVMLELAQYPEGEYVPLMVVAESQGISEKYLESIISALSKSGFVDGLRGKGGGYRLNRPVEEYTVGSILRIVEVPLRRWHVWWTTTRRNADARSAVRRFPSGRNSEKSSTTTSTASRWLT